MSKDNRSGALSDRLAAAPLLALVAAGLLGFMAIASGSQAQAVGDKPIRWLFNGAGGAAIAADREASHLLDNARPYVMKGRMFNDIPAAWDAVPFASFTNLQAIQNAVAEGGRLGPEIKGVMYDYERWQFTPEEEQRNPAPYVKMAADAVHARNLLFLTAPAVNLVRVMAPDEDRSRRYDTYLRLGIAADAARYADVVDIQAQGAEPNTELYASFVHKAAAQARQANPKVVVLAGLSTQPIGQRVTAADVLRAIASTRDVVDGYWFNIPRPSEYTPNATQFRPDIAIDVLHQLAGRQSK
jgi:hypothetical protein